MSLVLVDTGRALSAAGRFEPEIAPVKNLGPPQPAVEPVIFSVQMGDFIFELGQVFFHSLGEVFTLLRGEFIWLLHRTIHLQTYVTSAN